MQCCSETKVGTMYVAQESVKSTRVGSERVRKYKPVWLTRRKARWWRFCLTAKGPQTTVLPTGGIQYFLC